MMLRTLTLAPRFCDPLRRFLRLAWLGRLPLAGPAGGRPRPTFCPCCEALEDRRAPDDVRSLLAGGVLFGGALLDSPLLTPAAALTQGVQQETPAPAVGSPAPAAGQAGGVGDWQTLLASWQTSTQAQGRTASQDADQPALADQVFAVGGSGRGDPPDTDWVNSLSLFDLFGADTPQRAGAPGLPQAGEGGAGGGAAAPGSSSALAAPPGGPAFAPGAAGPAAPLTASSSSGGVGLAQDVGALANVPLPAATSQKAPPARTLVPPPVPAAPVAEAASLPGTADNAAGTSGYGLLPLSFEPNRGQDPGAGQFVAWGAGYHLGLDATGATLRLGGGEGTSAELRLQLLGADPAARGEGLGELPGKANYFLGRDQSKWVTDLPTYGQVRYADVYPGIDALYSGSSQRQFEYTFVVRPGASVGAIHLGVQGATGLGLDGTGELVVHTAGGDLVQHAPVLYQLDAAGQRQGVEGRFVLEAGGTVRFAAGAYDPARALYVDPVLSYSTYYGTSGADQANAVAVDSQGQAYLAGQTPGAAANSTEVFVLKLNAAGNAIVYRSVLGGTTANTTSVGNGLALDSSGDAFVVGTSTAADYPTTTGAYQRQLVGTSDVVLSKLNPAGNGLVYSTFAGGPAVEHGKAVAVDAAGYAYLTGDTLDRGTVDAYAARMNPQGSAYVYLAYLGGSYSDYGTGIAVDGSSNAYVVGRTNSGDFPVTAGAFRTTFLGTPGGSLYHGFLAKVSSTGSTVYATYLEGSGNDAATAVAVDAVADAFATGSTSSSDFPTTAGAFQRSLGGAGATNAFVVELSPSGAGETFGTLLGGSGTDAANAIALASGGAVAVAGSTTSSNFPTRQALQASNAGSGDAFWSVLAAGGGSLVASSFLGGSQADQANGVALDSAGGLYAVGSTSSGNFPTQNPLQAANAGGSDAFVTKVSFAAPVASNDSWSLPHDVTFSVPPAGVLANDSAPSGGPLTAALVSGPAHGTVSLQASGAFVYTPNAHYSGPDSFTYTASDGLQTSNTATVSLTVTDANAPVGVADSYSTPHDQALTVDAGTGVLANDTDADGDALSASVGTSPSHGTLALNSDGSFTYTPNAGYSGSDSFTYTASDGVLSSSAVTVSLTVSDTAPAAGNDSYGVQASRALTVGAAWGVLANDTDADGDALTASVATGPTHGSLTLNSDGSFTYTPTNGYTGSDSFTYRASDGALSGTATVSLTVHGSNSAPVANADSYSVLHDQALSVGGKGVLGNDTDADGDPLTASLVSGSGPSHGTLTLNSDGSFTYTPNAGYTGSDSFQYTAGDGLASSAAATVSITVNDPNAPVAVADTYSVGRNNTLTLSPEDGVLSNDSDADGDTLTASLVSGSGPSHGTLTLNSDGSFTYTPATGYVGSDSFQYKASDGVLTSAAATVSLTVSNTAPQPAPDSYAVLHDTALSVPAPGVLANDFDAEGDALTAAVGTQPQHGSVTMNADGSFTYTPATGYVGGDSFTYTASDGSLTSAAATVSVTVKGSNTAPVGVADSYSLAHDSGFSTSADTGVLSNDTDADGDPLLARLVTGPGHGTLTLNLDGSFSYTPNAGYSGSDSFVYQAFDGTANSANTTVSLTVTNDVPTAVADRYSVLASGTTTVTAANGVLVNDTDGEDDALTAVLATGPSAGSLTLNSDGSFSYTPGGSFTGSDSFTYKAYDGVNYSTPVTVTLTTAPAALDDSYGVAHDEVLSLDPTTGVLANDSVASGGALTATRVSGPSHGALTLNSDGSFTYTPAAGYVGTDSFTYYATGGGQNSNTATVTITVGNTAPQALDDGYSVNENATLSVSGSQGLLANDSDAEGDILSARLVAGPTHGTLVSRSDGSFTYTPSPGYFGGDSFTYQASDGLLTSNTATVNIAVDEVASYSPSVSGIAVGDFQNDGKLDFVVTNGSANTVTVFRGNGDATFAQQPSVSVGTDPVAVATGDFNRDGRLDLAVVNNGSNTVSILLGNGDGTFTAGSVLTTGSAPAAVAVGVFTSTGFQDLAVANSGAGTVSIFRGNGDGTFTAGAVLTVGSSPKALAVADFNADGRQDLAVANSGSNTISVLLGNGDGTFGSALSHAAGTNPVALVASNFDSDGLMDLAVANSGSNTVSVLPGQGDGTFGTSTDYAVDSGPVGLALGDFGGDGAGLGLINPDLTVISQGAGTLSVLPHGGTETLAGPVTLAAAAGPTAVAMGDFKGDGKNEAVAAVAAGILVAFTPAPTSALLPQTTRVAASTGSNSKTVAWGNVKGTVTFEDFGGARKFDLPAQKGQITALALNPKGRWLATAAEGDLRVKVWDVTGGRPSAPFLTMPPEKHPIVALAFSPDGQWLAAGTGGTVVPGMPGNRVVVYRYTPLFPLVRSYSVSHEAVTSIAFSADSSLLATADTDPASGDGRVRIFDTKTGKLLKTFRRAGETVSSVAFSADGKTFAAAWSDNQIFIDDDLFGTGKPAILKQSAIAVTFDATGTVLLTGDDQGIVKAWTLTRVGIGNILLVTRRGKDRRVTYPDHAIYQIAVDSNNDKILVSGERGRPGRVSPTGLELPEKKE